jgi:hypothetical protein
MTSHRVPPMADSVIESMIARFVFTMTKLNMCEVVEQTAKSGSRPETWLYVYLGYALRLRLEVGRPSGNRVS